MEESEALGEPTGNLLEWLYVYHILPQWVPRQAPFSFLMIAVLAVLSILATRNFQKIPGGLQNFMEWTVESLDNFTVGSIGPDGQRFTPLIGGFFPFILFNNLLSVFPGVVTPTASLNTTIALGLCAIIAVHYHGIKANGVKVWASHFVGEPVWMAPLMIPLHIIGELARPLSLSLRLYGNIFGEDVVIAILASFSPILIRIAGVPLVALPVQLPMLLFSLFTDFLQALVFTMLLSIYISVTVGDHAHGHDEAHEHAEDATGAHAPSVAA
jgi:F-type H+-transporting ATPase subunit a